ncbi:adenylate/guanylate cyclase domain-containing protein [Sneathiella chungangensis]|uniref:Adenylate/guanylate cyclase domain-containing protein n=1 Tax=Sneathiella chungangensis TaxID=1418234 RepID=A0A845MIZ2_9PROT|nr:adenylate/guanylate cyclase domain-containing protein [Sneathiella chungangensis]MZR23799.1 adenylate/guanylate cyclase domain-containing protein [Sneathiella chungangensis]
MQRQLETPLKKSPPEPSENTDLSHRLLVLSALMMAIAAVFWGGLYAYFGEFRAAAIPWGYSVISFIFLLLFRHEHGFVLLRTSQLLLSLLLPFLLMWELGGFINSSAVVIWSLTSPMGALVFANRRVATWWFIAFILLVIIGAAISFGDGTIDNRLPPALIVILFVMNLSGVSIVAFVLLVYFVGQKDQTFNLLAIERQRSEDLICNMLPEAIGERLKREKSPIADRLENVTILFADISGFTNYSMNRTPEEIVTLLDQVFSAFDEMASRYGLEKIKTIGDAYMVCGGLQGDPEKSAANAANFACETIAYLTAICATQYHGLNIRVGMNTGSVVAGVIGHTKFSYDIWGDAVNVAARLQQAAKPGQILLSKNTADLLGDDFTLLPQGETELKGHTPVVTYILGRRARS